MSEVLKKEIELGKIRVCIDEDVYEGREEVIGYRRHFRRNPEPSLKEYATAEFIRKELSKNNIEYRKVGETGTIAYIRGYEDGKTVFLRGDIDALELNDEIDRDYASSNRGLCHGCGHDAHAASLLGAAKILNKRRDRIKGTVKIAFQQAEEIGAGARIFVREGHLDDVDFAFGIHIASYLDTGKIGITYGEQSASCDIFKIHIKGEGAHACSPHLGNDALIASVNIVSALQNIITRETDPMERTLISIGKINSGTRYNVIAGEGEIEGTVRAFNNFTRNHIIDRIEKVAQLTAAVHGCRAEFENYKAAEPLINEKEKTEFVQKAALSIVDDENIIKDLKATMGAEDFADYLEKVPGTFVKVGCRNPEDKSTHYPHHHTNFDIDERALLISTQLYVEAAQKYLKKPLHIVDFIK